MLNLSYQTLKLKTFLLHEIFKVLKDECKFEIIFNSYMYLQNELNA